MTALRPWGLLCLCVTDANARRAAERRLALQKRTRTPTSLAQDGDKVSERPRTSPWAVADSSSRQGYGGAYLWL